MVLKGQPKIQIEKKPLWQFIDYICISLIACTLVYIFIKYSELPDQIPIHFNGKGEADSYGGKGSLWMLPIVSIFLYALLTIAAKYPHTFNYIVKITEENAEKQYMIAIEMMVLLKLGIILFFSYFTYREIQIAMSGHGGLGIASTIFFIGGLGVLIIRALLQSSETT